MKTEKTSIDRNLIDDIEDKFILTQWLRQLKGRCLLRHATQSASNHERCHQFSVFNHI